MIKKAVLLVMCCLTVMSFRVAAETATTPLPSNQTPYTNLSNLDVKTESSASSVLLMLADDSSNADLLKSELISLGVPSIDVLSVHDYTPGLGELTPYDVIVVWSNYTFEDPDKLGSILADYVDSGKSVIMGNFTWYSGYALGGKIQEPGYSPFTLTNSSSYSTSCLGEYNSSHPVMDGVSAACDVYRDNVVLESESVLVASWADGVPFVAANEKCNVIGITSYPGSNKLSSGDVSLIYYNAINLLADCNQDGKSIFNGIHGGGIGDIDDDPDKTITIIRNKKIQVLVDNEIKSCKDRKKGCNPKNEKHFLEITQSRNGGGIVSLGYYFTGIKDSKSAINTPGNSDVSKAYTVKHYEDGDNVYVVGFSAGGGDAQNLLEKLNDLDIPVQVSGHIDSVEIGDDASIPENTKLAKGFYQKQSQRVVRGENRLKAINSALTKVTNKKIVDPVGPSDPNTSKNAHHRNMDNDPTVVDIIKNAMTKSLEGSNSPKKSTKTTTSCHNCLYIADNGNNISDWISFLKSRLEDNRGESLFQIRKLMAKSIETGPQFQQLIVEYKLAEGHTRLRQNLTAVIQKVDAKRFIRDLEVVAKNTSNYPLFIAITHSLGAVETIGSKKSLIRLVSENNFHDAPGRVIDAVISGIDDTVSVDQDSAWMLEWVRDNRVNDNQMYVMTALFEDYKNDDSINSLLGEISIKVSDPVIREKVLKAIAIK